MRHPRDFGEISPEVGDLGADAGKAVCELGADAGKAICELGADAGK